MKFKGRAAEAGMGVPNLSERGPNTSMPTGTIVVVVEPFFVDSSQHWRASLSWCLGHDLAR